MPQQNRLLDEFLESLAGKAESTVSTYRRELGSFCPGSQRVRATAALSPGINDPGLLWRPIWFIWRERATAQSSRAGEISGRQLRALVDRGENLLRRNPARGVMLPPQPLLAPRQLTPDQRYVLRSLVEREDDCAVKRFLRWAIGPAAE